MRPREGMPLAQGHEAMPPNPQPDSFRERAAAPLPWPPLPFHPSFRSDQGPPAQHVFLGPLPGSIQHGAPSLTCSRSSLCLTL